MAKQKPNMKQSGNPVTVLVSRLGFKGNTAIMIEWAVFLTLLFIVGGILLGGT